MRSANIHSSFLPSRTIRKYSSPGRSSVGSLSRLAELTVLIGWIAFPEDGFDQLCEKHIVSAETCHIALTFTLANGLHRCGFLHRNHQSWLNFRGKVQYESERLTTHLGTMSTTASMSGGYKASCDSSWAILAGSLIKFYGGRTAGADDTDDHIGLPSFSPAVVMLRSRL